MNEEDYTYFDVEEHRFGQMADAGLVRVYVDMWWQVWEGKGLMVYTRGGVFSPQCSAYRDMLEGRAWHFQPVRVVKLSYVWLPWSE